MKNSEGSNNHYAAFVETFFAAVLETANIALPFEVLTFLLLFVNIDFISI